MDTRNIVPKKQEQTFSETVILKTDPETGVAFPLVVQVPDNMYAYGDARSVALITEDVVGKHSGSNAEAHRAHEAALEQLSETDFKQLERKRRYQAFLARKPRMAVYESPGGYRVEFLYQNPDGLLEVRERFVSWTEMERNAAGGY
jgi:hypothetical protein